MSERTYKCIGIHEAEGLLRRDNLLILDVRDADSFRKSHIPGAQHITIGNLFPVVNGTDRRSPILIYCYHGHASREYAQIFADFRFAEVYSLNGGYEAWNAWLRASTTSDRKLQMSDC